MAGFQKAKAEQAALKIGIYGPPGSGKTFTSLLLAEGLAALTKKQIAYLDTERGTDFYCQRVAQRKVHPEAFEFDALYTRSLTEAADAIYKLDSKTHGVVVGDSITHLWEAARNAYEGRMTKDGSIPFQAWGKIKRPYKELLAYLLSSPLHVIICGREGNEYAEDNETGELKQVGKKMKAEGETAYEPHILIRMEPHKGKANQVYQAVVEKDRTGILAGQVIENPTFESICAPLLGLLGKQQAVIPTEEETAVQDATALADIEAAKAKISATYFEDFDLRMKMAKTMTELDAVTKELTPAIKKLMSTQDVTNLRDAYHARTAILTRPDVA